MSRDTQYLGGTKTEGLNAEGSVPPGAAVLGPNECRDKTGSKEPTWPEQKDIGDLELTQEGHPQLKL